MKFTKGPNRKRFHRPLEIEIEEYECGHVYRVQVWERYRGRDGRYDCGQLRLTRELLRELLIGLHERGQLGQLRLGIGLIPPRRLKPQERSSIQRIARVGSGR